MKENPPKKIHHHRGTDIDESEHIFPRDFKVEMLNLNAFFRVGGCFWLFFYVSATPRLAPSCSESSGKPLAAGIFAHIISYPFHTFIFFFFCSSSVGLHFLFVSASTHSLEFHESIWHKFFKRQDAVCAPLAIWRVHCI